jgi:hypothetical protein
VFGAEAQAPIKSVVPSSARRGKVVRMERSMNVIPISGLI